MNRGRVGEERGGKETDECLLTAVSVDSISTSTRRDISPGLAATTYLTGNRCSQAGRQLRQFGMGGLEGVCMTSVLFVMHI
jgi:hypothetical protein